MLNHVTAGGSLKPRTRRWVGVAIVVMASGGILAHLLGRFQAPSASSTQTPIVAPITTVTALGHLQPTGEVIKLSAPTSSNGNRVDQLLVKEGDRVKVGQVIAVLDNHDRLQAALSQAQEDLKVAQAQLAITQAGAKRGEIAAQQAEIGRLAAQYQGEIRAKSATVARLKAELRNAETEYSRYEALYQEGAIAASERDSKHLALDTAQQSLQEAEAELNQSQSTSPPDLNKAKATLEQIAEVRPVDVAHDRAEVDRAVAAVNQAKAELEQAYVRSPLNGEVLYLHTRSGEVVSNDGIVEIGQTQNMEALAEVYQSDVSKVRVGQPVRVSSDSIPGELRGSVASISSQVRRQTIINTDPSTNIDARVVEVHVALDPASSQKAAKFTNLQVKVVLGP
jgi:HlyD family secretion protein